LEISAFWNNRLPVKVAFIKVSYVQIIYSSIAGDVKVAVCRILGVFGGGQLCSPKCNDPRVSGPA